MVFFLSAIAMGSPTVETSSAANTTLRKRFVDEPADVVLLYAGEQQGSQDTCGCPVNPRGSLGRLHTYADALRDRGEPVVLVNAGNWLGDTIGDDHTLREDVRVGNAHMVQAMEAGEWSALNVGYRDLPYLGEQDAYPVGAVSGNTAKGPPGFVVVDAGELKVAITGLSSWRRPYLQPEGVDRLEPVKALEALLPEMEAAADVVVVLAYALESDAKAVADLDIDVLVEADTFRTRFDPILRGDTVWVRSNFETQRLGELRLTIEDGVVTGVHDRFIDLDAQIGSAGSWRRRLRKSEAAVKQSREALFGPR